MPVAQGAGKLGPFVHVLGIGGGVARESLFAWFGPLTDPEKEGGRP